MWPICRAFLKQVWHSLVVLVSPHGFARTEKNLFLKRQKEDFSYIAGQKTKSFSQPYWPLQKTRYVKCFPDGHLTEAKTRIGSSVKINPHYCPAVFVKTVSSKKLSLLIFAKILRILKILEIFLHAIFF